MAGMGDIPRGSELVGVESDDFERPGELILTEAHPASVERIFHALRAEESVPRPMELVSQILHREPFHQLEVGDGSVYAAAEALGPDTLQRMAKTGKLSRENGSPLIGGVKTEPVPNRPNRGSWGFVSIKNRAGVPPVRAKELGPHPSQLPSPEAEVGPEAAVPLAEGGGPGDEAKPREEFPGWLIQKEPNEGARVRPMDQGSLAVSGANLEQGAAGSVKGGGTSPTKVDAQRAETSRKPVQLTVPTSAPASWAQGKKKVKPVLVQKNQVSGTAIFPEVNLVTGVLCVTAGVVVMAGAMWIRGHGVVVDVPGYYRWEVDELQKEIRGRRAKQESAMQQHGDLRQLQREDRELGDLEKIAGVLNERSRR